MAQSKAARERQRQKAAQERRKRETKRQIENLDQHIRSLDNKLRLMTITQQSKELSRRAKSNAQDILVEKAMASQSRSRLVASKPPATKPVAWKSKFTKKVTAEQFHGESAKQAKTEKYNFFDYMRHAHFASTAPGTFMTYFGDSCHMTREQSVMKIQAGAVKFRDSDAGEEQARTYDFDEDYEYLDGDDFKKGGKGSSRKRKEGKDGW